MRESYIDSEFYEIWCEDGIVFSTYKKDTVLSLEVSKLSVRDRLIASNKRPMPFCCDLRNVVTTDTRARKYMATKEAVEYLTAGAFLIDNEIMRLAGNIFIKIDKPLVPAKLFTDKAKALIWLQQFKFMS